MLKFGPRKPQPDVSADREHLHDGGLAVDLPELMGRRRSLAVLGGSLVGVSAIGLGGCSSDTATSAATSSSTTSQKAAGTASSVSGADSTSCSVIPSETEGPYPGDGSNGPDVLAQSGVVRSDIRSSFGDASGTAEGVEMELVFRVLDTKNGCAPLVGAALYAWHCDALGRYSMYSNGAEDENYLRGVQITDDDGYVRFTTIFPGAYQGRWPHVHFEVYASEDDAVSAKNKLRTSQLAFPQEICDEVYAGSGYDGSARNMTSTPLDRDGIFRDGYSLQMATMTGSIGDGLTGTLTAPV